MRTPSSFTRQLKSGRAVRVTASGLSYEVTAEDGGQLSEQEWSSAHMLISDYQQEQWSRYGGRCAFSRSSRKHWPPHYPFDREPNDRMAP